MQTILRSFPRQLNAHDAAAAMLLRAMQRSIVLATTGVLIGG